MMPSRLAAAACVLAAACNQLYGIEPTTLDMELDSDDDGVSDVIDNCPDADNLDQRDFDRDEIGDACDNCPLFPNTQQLEEGEPSGERDGIGDDCDPNPTIGSDCLILIDQFADAAQLAQHWELVPSGTDASPTLEHAGDHVVLTSFGVNTPGFMIARHAGSRVNGRFSVSAVGAFELTSLFTEAMNVTDFTDPDRYLSCGVQTITDYISTYIRFQLDATSSQVAAGYVSGPPIRDDLSIRLVVERATEDVARCTLKWGVAEGVTRTSNMQMALPAGGAGFGVRGKPVTLRGIAFYETRATCPAPIIR